MTALGEAEIVSAFGPSGIRTGDLCVPHAVNDLALSEAFASDALQLSAVLDQNVKDEAVLIDGAPKPVSCRRS
jgi:hypothetical protein